MSTTAQTSPELSPEPYGLQPTLEELSQNTRLLITLRWVAGFSILAGTVFSRVLLGIHLLVLPLACIGLLVLGYNALLSAARQRGEDSLSRLQRIVWGQILLDWLAMIALVHFTGGITSPALIYFVVHAVLSGIILLPWQVRSLTALVIVIVGGIAWAESSGGLSHVTIAEFDMGRDLYRNSTYIAAVIGFFGTTVFTLSELVTHIVQRLRQREERIRQLYEARSTFVRVATHELRAPLAAGISLMKNIDQGYAGELSEQQAAIIRRVIIRLDGLRTLIDDLLTLAMSREASTAQAPLSPDSLRTVLEKIIERELPNAEQKHIQLDRQLCDDPGIIMVGNVGLQVILGNLINNAIKYTPDGGQVTVHYAINPVTRAAEVTVADSGIGIPAEDLPHIFDEFFRAKNAKNAQITGTGIGLSTVKTLVERYHGHIALQSEEGKGSTVKVSLPLAPKSVLAEIDAASAALSRQTPADPQS